jgi:hypothetical protein
MVKIKQVDECFCKSCGEVIKKDAEICVKCGVRQRHSVNTTTSVSGQKNKMTAIILAILISPATYLYTYKTDAIKFWIGVGCVTIGWMLLFPPFIFMIYAIVDIIRRPEEFYINY